MTSEHWQRIKSILHSALERAPGERAAFLDEACAVTPSLRSEVESLIVSYEQAGGFIESPAIEFMADSLGDQTDALVGQSFGPYQIDARIGTGGMGEVYLAQDSRLGRKVALKMLPDYFTRDDERVRRFQQEARAASALNHPNILTIYEIGQIDSRHFIATEFIEGETLRERMTRSQMKIGEALDIAIQIASALAAAHRLGIVHRDIKPENVMLRQDGLIKVLDFGLAKLTERKTVESEAATLVNTRLGIVMGTVRYMSPEQARGLGVDERTDIFSLGIVLYEMLTGRTPFEGATSSDIIVSILAKEPMPLSQFATEVPADLEGIISKALRKDCEGRYQTAKELLADLGGLKQQIEFKAQLESSRSSQTSTDKTQSVTSIRASDQTSPRAAIDTLPVQTIATSTREKLITPVREHTRLAVAVFVIVIAATAVLIYYHHRANLRWAESSVSKVEELARSQKYSEAYTLAIQVQKYLPNDTMLARLMPEISDDISVTTEPSNARVYLKLFPSNQSDQPRPRQLIGNTPISHLKIARGEYVIYIEKEGYAPIEKTMSSALSRAESTYLAPSAIHLEERMFVAQNVPDRMIFVPGGGYKLVSWDQPAAASAHLDDFFIDKFEVTNREYKEFINAGGYLKNSFWKYPFVKDGRVLTWDEASSQMHDRTGLPGPRSWSNQNYLESKAEYPVTDITWYEAAAYAQFRGKQLPTIFQWEKAARNGAKTHFAGMTLPWGWSRPGETFERRANFRGSAPVPVDSLEFGMSPYGCYNMAGNVSEWCFNEHEEGYGTSGGSWQDPAYMFGRISAFPGFYSSSSLGFRCALTSPGSAGDQGAMKIITKQETAVFVPSKALSFDALASHYRYEKIALDPQIIEVIETEAWRREKITMAGAGGERAIAYLYLPKNARKPFQTIQFVPGDDASYGRSVPEYVETLMTPYIRSGRAVFAVVFKGHIEREYPPGHKGPSGKTVEYGSVIVNRAIDLRRGLDYLETRGDIDTSRIAYCGISGGASRDGLIFTAVESRYRSIILMGGGLLTTWSEWLPEFNPVNFVPYIRAPKLLLNGRYDEVFAFKTEAEPLYRLLPEPKRLALFDGGHFASLEVAAPIINGWLDETLEPVKH